MKALISLKFLCVICLVVCVSSNVMAQTSNEVGYPKPAHFKRISWESMDDLMYLDQVVVGTIGKDYLEYEAMAIEFKRRKPSATVLVQYYWDAYPRIVPLQIAKANTWYDNKYDDVYYAYPKYNGYFLPLSPTKINNNISINQNTFTVSFDEIPDTWIKSYKTAQNRTWPSKAPFAMIYTIDENGNADFEKSEFIKMTQLNEANRTAEFRRLAPLEGEVNHSYVANKARIGIQTLTVNYPDVWYLNFSKLAPKDPETGMSATEFMAKHLANYYRERLSSIDGFSFDVPNYHPIKGLDIDNDGVADDGYYNNINYHGLGIYDFYYNLRYGSAFDTGLGDDVILVQDGQFMTDQRFASLLNGCENEDFPSIQDWSLFSSSINVHWWWADRAKKPNASFLAMRYPTDAYHNTNDTNKLTKFMHNSTARIGIATACFGNGVAVYESSRVWLPNEFGGRDLIYGDAEVKPGEVPLPYILPQDTYMWDEYSGGTDDNFDWLGQPIEERKYLTSHLGNDLLKIQNINDWSKITNESAVQINDYTVDNLARSVSFKIDFTDLPQNRWLNWGDKALIKSANAFIQSGALSVQSKDTEFCVNFTCKGENVYTNVDTRYDKIPVPLGFRIISLDSNDRGVTQFVFADNISREYSLTLVSPSKGGRLALEIISGTEPGAYEINNISLREGAAEVMYRKFENGLVLMNGSKDDANIFNLDEIDPEGKYKKLEGVVDPVYNDGSKVEGNTSIPAFDALFLQSDDALSVDDENVLSKKLKIYPNPASTLLLLELVDSKNSEIKQIHIYNLVGKMIKSISDLSSNSIDISDLSEGMYIIKVDTSNYNSMYSKVIVKR